MSAYEITVSVTPLCSCCGAELVIGCTESKSTGHPLERDNPYERAARRVFFLPCDKCFVFRPHVADLLTHAKESAAACAECNGAGVLEFHGIGGPPGSPCPACADVRALIDKATGAQP